MAEPHVCTCETCSPEPYEDRCKHEKAFRQVVLSWNDLMNEKDKRIRELEAELEAKASALWSALAELEEVCQR